MLLIKPVQKKNKKKVLQLFWTDLRNFDDKIFTNGAPLGRVGHRVAMSVCLSVCLKKKNVLDKSRDLLKFISVLLSASVERVGVSRMQDFSLKRQIGNLFILLPLAY